MKKKKSKSPLKKFLSASLQKKVSYITTFLTITFFIFVVISFINPTLSKKNEREFCQSEEDKYDEGKFCVEFSSEKKLLNDAAYDISITKDGKEVYTRGFNFFQTNQELSKVIDKLDLEWSERGLEIDFKEEEQKTNISKDFFIK
ncbi:MAG: hypothetical protein Q9M91_01505 [Candidatus Dojkabacteria bacterium]|nr:hypothetical protein [Candidatus Dojkabacteria bacterium]MDQ7020501.1 hypothetical protein [Candidatus Dojkabacteria bacterium]